ncbi:MAG: non-heme iron oxygenase ferredoxin subunit [Deltaproteobacteria bacterium]|nr:MAG: non-heme iron oxygenase ferredoxin subunit [Deltaproteobacteria bacterium]
MDLAEPAAIEGLAPGAPVDRPTVRQALRRARPGCVVPARLGRRPVALVVLPDGSAYAVDDRCPHDGGPLSSGFVDGGALVCDRHGWEVDVCTGRCPLRPGAGVASRRVR